MLKSLLLLFLIFSTLWSEEYYDETASYSLGEGLKVGELPLYLGGYFSLDYRYRDEESRYRIDDIAALAYGNYNKFSYMAEVEFKEFYAYTSGEHNSSVQKDTSLHLERLYLDYTFNENFMLRLGKYNTPVGFWNLLPINVLRDTSSNPYSSEILFPKFTTGALLSYTSYNESDIQIDVMLQQNSDIDPSYNNYEMDEHYSFGLSYAHENLTLKFNAGAFDNLLLNNTSEQLYYALASIKYENDKYKISSEIGSQRSNNAFTTEYAGYLQALYRFAPKHAGIIRLEAYKENRLEIKDELAIFAYTYRPLFPIALKTEYKIDSLHRDNQFIFSFSVLF